MSQSKKLTEYSRSLFSRQIAPILLQKHSDQPLNSSLHQSNQVIKKATGPFRCQTGLHSNCITTRSDVAA